MDIALTVFALHERLLGIVADTNDMRGIARNTRDFGQSTGNELGLIVTTPTLTGGM